MKRVVRSQPIRVVKVELVEHVLESGCHDEVGWSVHRITAALVRFRIRDEGPVVVRVPYHVLSIRDTVLLDCFVARRSVCYRTLNFPRQQ